MGARIMFSRLMLRTKLALLLGLSCLAVVASIAFGASMLRDRMTRDRVDELRAVVDSTVAIARGLQARIDAGTITRDQGMAQMGEVIHSLRFDGGNGYISLTSTNGTMLVHGVDPSLEGKPSPATDSTGRPIISLETEALRDSDQAVIAYSFHKPNDTRQIPKLAYVVRFAPWKAIFLAGAYTDDLDATFRAALMRVSFVGGLILLVSLLISWLVNRDIGKTLDSLRDAMTHLADGDLTVAVPGVARRDQLGGMARAMLVFRQNAEAARALEGEAERIRVAKDRRQHAIDQHTQDFGTSASGVMTTLVGSAQSMRELAGEMTLAAHRTLETAERTALNASNSAENLGSVAAAAEEMSASIREISQQVTRVTDAARVSVRLASATDLKVGGMAEAVERVGTVVRLISDIAGRTNLLALNATIEAARAGEAGRGFAVVAGEVKALAAQTAKATEEITSQIATIRAATGEAVNAVREVSSAIGQVNEVAAAIAEAVEQQAATTREIAASVQTVTVATRQASDDMRDVSAVSGSAEVASQNVARNADEVSGVADVLRSEMTQFLTAIAKTGDDDRRRYERIDGGGTEAALRAPGHPELRATIVDISRGGVALRTNWSAAAGAEVQIVLPGVGAFVVARVVRTAGGQLSVAFRQDETMLRHVDAALEHISGRRLAA
jgi:methyl-accepting chemotaxis protein